MFSNLKLLFLGGESLSSKSGFRDPGSFYLVALPSLINGFSGLHAHFSWHSTQWVQRKYRGKSGAVLSQAPICIHGYASSWVLSYQRCEFHSEVQSKHVIFLTTSPRLTGPDSWDVKLEQQVSVPRRTFNVTVYALYFLRRWSRHASHVPIFSLGVGFH